VDHGQCGCEDADEIVFSETIGQAHRLLKEI